MRVLSLLILWCCFTLSATAQIVLVNQGFSKYATPAGGKDEINYIFSREVSVPEEQLTRSLDSTVSLSFIVSESGTVKDIKVVKSGGELADKEAIRVVNLIQWDPAVYHDKPVDTFQELSFHFNGKKIKRWYRQRGFSYLESNNATDFSVIERPEKQAQYFYGNQALPEFFSKNIQYPGEAKSKNIQGEVILSFIIEKKGYPSNIQIEKSLGGGCDQEAIRVLRQSRWKAATVEGLPVRSRMKLPVSFQLNTQLTNGISTEQKPY